MADDEKSTAGLARHADHQVSGCHSSSRRPPQQGPSVHEPDLEVTAKEDSASPPPNARHRDRARPRGAGSPTPRSQTRTSMVFSSTRGPPGLRPVRRARRAFEQRPDPVELRGVADDHRMGIADVDGENGCRRPPPLAVTTGPSPRSMRPSPSRRALTSRSPTSTEISRAPVGSASHAAAIRVPLPHISASRRPCSRWPPGTALGLLLHLEDAVGVANLGADRSSAQGSAATR